MDFPSRHCCSLSQQQCAAAEAAANQSSRSCNTWSLRQSTKHGNKQCLCLRSSCYWQEGAFEKLKYTPRKCAHDAHPRGVLISAAVDLARRRRRNFARRHNDSCKMTYAIMALWKRGPGSLIAATGLQKLASSQHGGWLAEEDEERIAGCSADRRCRERSELEGVVPPSRYKRLKSNIALPGMYTSGKCGQMKWGGAPLRFPKRTRGVHSRKASP